MLGKFTRIDLFARALRAMVLLSLIGWLAPLLHAGPKVWIFNGDPGDQEHHQRYQKILADLSKTFTTTYGIPAADVHVFYGPREMGYEGICDKATILAELKKASDATRDPACSSVWIILQGHANTIPGGALFNLPGPDVSPREISTALEGAAPEKPLVIFATTTASTPFLRQLSAPGRIVITANSEGDPENETDFPLALAAALAARSTDANKDGFVSATELFTTCHEWIEEMYNSSKFIIQEHPQMDGNGDGRGTRRPAAIDGDPGMKALLKLGGEKAGTGTPAPAYD